MKYFQRIGLQAQGNITQENLYQNYLQQYQKNKKILKQNKKKNHKVPRLMQGPIHHFMLVKIHLENLCMIKKITKIKILQKIILERTKDFKY